MGVILSHERKNYELSLLSQLYPLVDITKNADQIGNMAFEGISLRPFWVVPLLPLGILAFPIAIVPFFAIIPLMIFLGGVAIAFWPPRYSNRIYLTTIGIIYIFLSIICLIIFVFDILIYGPLFNCDGYIKSTLKYPGSYEFIKETNLEMHDPDDLRGDYSSIFHYSYLDGNGRRLPGRMRCSVFWGFVKLSPVEPGTKIYEISE